MYYDQNPEAAEHWNRSAALGHLYKMQTEVRWAQEALELAENNLIEARAILDMSDCDHPDTTGHICDHCGSYDDNPDTREDEDFYRVMESDCTGLRSELGHVDYSWDNSYPSPARH